MKTVVTFTLEVEVANKLNSNYAKGYRSVLINDLLTKHFKMLDSKTLTDELTEIQKKEIELKKQIELEAAEKIRIKKEKELEHIRRVDERLKQEYGMGVFKNYVEYEKRQKQADPSYKGLLFGDWIHLMMDRKKEFHDIEAIKMLQNDNTDEFNFS